MGLFSKKKKIPCPRCKNLMTEDQKLCKKCVNELCKQLPDPLSEYNEIIKKLKSSRNFQSIVLNADSAIKLLDIILPIINELRGYYPYFEDTYETVYNYASINFEEIWDYFYSQRTANNRNLNYSIKSDIEKCCPIDEKLKSICNHYMNQIHSLIDEYDLDTRELSKSLDFNKMNLENEIRIINESSHIIENSVNIKTAISRLEFIQQHCEYLKYAVSNNLYNDSSCANDYYNRYVKGADERFKDIVLRCYNDTKEKAMVLKTEKAQANKINKFFDLLLSLKGTVSKEQYKYIEEFIVNEIKKDPENILDKIKK